MQTAVAAGLSNSSSVGKPKELPEHANVFLNRLMRTITSDTIPEKRRQSLRTLASEVRTGRIDPAKCCKCGGENPPENIEKFRIRCDAPGCK